MKNNKLFIILAFATALVACEEEEPEVLDEPDCQTCYILTTESDGEKELSYKSQQQEVCGEAIEEFESKEPIIFDGTKKEYICE